MDTTLEKPANEENPAQENAPNEETQVQGQIPSETKTVKKRGPYKKRGETERDENHGVRTEETEGEDQGLPPFAALWGPRQEKAAREAGRKSVQMLINFPGLYNPDLLPLAGESTEKAAIAFMEAGGEYFVSRKMGDMPPGMAFAMAGMGYYAVLLSQERNRGFMKETWAKIKGAWAWWRAKRSVK
jgi:hypothetical protein